MPKSIKKVDIGSFVKLGPHRYDNGFLIDHQGSVMRSGKAIVPLEEAIISIRYGWKVERVTATGMINGSLFANCIVSRA